MEVVLRSWLDVQLPPQTYIAFWDMGVNSNLKWLPLFSPDEAGESGPTKELYIT